MGDINYVWTCETAVMELYLADMLEEDEWSDSDECADLLKKVIRDTFDGVENAKNEMALMDMDIKKAKKPIITVVNAIKNNMPDFKIVDTLHRVLWMRFAFQSVELPVCDLSIEKFSEWRANAAADGLRVMLYKSADGRKWRGRRWTPNGIGEILGFTFDDIIFGKSFKVDPYKVTWKEQLYSWPKRKFEKQSGGAFVPGKDLESTTKKKTARTPSKKNVATALTQAVRKALRSKSIDGMKKQPDGRYQCDVHRVDFIKQLMKAAPEIKRYEISTLIRMLPKVVQCPRGRPGGL